MSTAPIYVAIVEDMDDLRRELSGLVSTDAGFKHVGAAASGEDAISLLPSLKPDVVLMDIGLPGISGVECVRRLKPLMPKTNFMMLTIFEDHEQVCAALMSGATGYLVKGSPWDRVRESIAELHAGGSPMTSSIAREVIRSMVRFQSGLGMEQFRLSLREEEVLRALASGRRYKEIAVQFSLSPHTVRTHIHRIYQKLHVRNKTQATQVLRAQGNTFP